MKRRLALLTGIAALALAGAPGTMAAPNPGPAYTDWNPGYIGFSSRSERSPRRDCVSGADACIDRTLGEMWRRFHRYVPPCDHNSVFSLTYLRVTQDIAGGVDDGFYPHERWLNHLDAIFARMYFDGYDNWRTGRWRLVPPAWRIAFGVNERREVKGIGNLLLSMNAHVQRDFPFVLYHAGLVDAQGNSLKPDHDSGNARLEGMYHPMLEELSRRFDETIDDYDIPGIAVDDDTFFEILVQWREIAWDNAVRLAEAETDAERRAVAADIEAYATQAAYVIYAGSVYLPGEDKQARNKRCKQFGGQDPAYPRGADSARPGAFVRLAGSAAAVRVRCADGPGPCRGILGLSIPGVDGEAKQTFSLRARERGYVLLGTGKLRDELARAAEHGRRVRVRVKSLLRPGKFVEVAELVELRD